MNRQRPTRDARSAGSGYQRLRHHQVHGGRPSAAATLSRVIPDLDAWDAWHPHTVAQRLADVKAPWCVAAGWALDLFRGVQTRPHADLEIAVSADRFAEVAACFDDCDFFVVHNGEVLPATAETMRIGHQTWAQERATGTWRFDVFREPHDGDVWTCRRDPRIRRPYDSVIRHDPNATPYMAPEIVLLFKAKGTRDKDQADFHGVLALLDPDQRQWLDNALALVHPAHPWRDLIVTARRR